MTLAGWGDGLLAQAHSQALRLTMSVTALGNWAISMIYKDYLAKALQSLSLRNRLAGAP